MITTIEHEEIREIASILGKEDYVVYLGILTLFYLGAACPFEQHPLIVQQQFSASLRDKSETLARKLPQLPQKTRGASTENVLSFLKKTVEMRGNEPRSVGELHHRLQA